MKIDDSSTSRKKCVVCRHKTGHYKEWAYTVGIEIDVPLCENCNKKVGWCLDTAMETHLKGIAESVRMSQIITYHEEKANHKNHVAVLQGYRKG